ncbi:MAG: hypothetical protein ACD_47C00097G0004 [uncultured bacterium]|uniref:Uncharacterized protein n=1 Tax=Candidatus Wallbacteria bacterium GWC2_49_35 TaxID=1817813 RepID=A0A1F7WYW6_9BACT|nr:MAG: hypothetical protein ACD_47C00097G0004 [uncultured bacterium]OGM07897.1 MAG: hypothetical protein A2008_11830 [Candidatus Wallbacteria bacterium GWC2_49_35]HBC76618.1 hypothetical protein [Candidatus Wallbacteria bacterium]
MRKNSVWILSILIFVFMVSINPAFAAGKDESTFSKSRQLMQARDGENAEEPVPAPGDPGTPSAPSIPAPDNGNAPIPENIKLYYCVVPKDQVTNLEALCNKYGAPILVYRAFNQLVVMKRLGVVVTVNPKDKYFIGKLRKYYHAKPLKDVSFRVVIHVSSIAYGVNLKKEDFVTGDFGGCDEILGKMVKKPFGHGCSMFKTIAKSFPGLLDKVTVKEKEYLGFGKKRKMLLNPVVTLEMLALNMNGKGKNVTLYHNKFYYETIKHAANYNWNK